MPPFKPAAAMASCAMPIHDQFQRRRNTLRVRYWHRILRDIARPCGLPPVPAVGESTRCTLGPLLIARSKTTATTFVRDAATIAGSAFSRHVMAVLMLRGSLRGASGEHYMELRRGDIGFFDLSHPAEIQASEGSQLSVLLPRDMLRGPIQGMVLHESHLTCRMLARHIEQLVCSLPAMGQARVEALAQSTLSVMQLCIDFSPPPDAGASAAPMRASIMAYIDANLDDPAMTPESIANAFHVSRTWLYKHFAGTGGVKRYIRDKRLDAAFHELCNDPQQRVIDIAYRHGFSSERQFQRAFQLRFDMTPSAVRNRRKQGAPGD